MRSPFAWLGHRRFAIALGLLLLAGGIVQTLLALSLWSGPREGDALQAALLVTQGRFPMISFPDGPQPLLSFLLAPVVLLFGPNLLAVRGLMILFNLLTALTIAGIAKGISHSHGEVVALASAALYLFAPLAAVNEVLIQPEGVAALLVAASFYFLVRQERTAWAGNYPLAGVLLGLAILARSGAVAILLVWGCWAFLGESRMRPRLRSVGILLAPAGLIPGVFYLYVAHGTSIIWAGASFRGISPVSPYNSLILPAQLEVWGFLLMVGVPFFLVPLALFLGRLRERIPLQVASVATSLAVAGVAALLATYSFNVDWTLGEVLTPYVSWTLAIAFLAWLALVIRETDSRSNPPPLPNRILLLLGGWGVVIVGGDILVGGRWSVATSSDVLVPLSLGFGAWFATLCAGREPLRTPHGFVSNFRGGMRQGLWRKGLSISLVLLLVLSSTVVALWIYGPTNPNNTAGYNGENSETFHTYSPVEIAQVGAYLKQEVKSGQDLFTLDTSLADAAGLSTSPSFGGLERAYFTYLLSEGGSRARYDTLPDPSAPPDLLPSLPQILAEWNATDLGWFVQGYWTNDAMAHSPLLAWYVASFYHPVATFGDPLSFDVVVVLSRGAPPVLSAVPTSHVVTPPYPEASVLVNNTMYIASRDSNQITYLSPAGENGAIPVALPGSTVLAGDFGDLWIGSDATPQIEIWPIHGGTPEIVSVGNDPTAFAPDLQANEMFVATYPSGNVTALGMSANHTWWNILWSRTVGGGITGLATDPGAGALYVALPDQYTLTVLDESTGNLLGSQAEPFPPYALAYADGGLVATWWIGNVYRLSLQNYTSPTVVGSTNVGNGTPEIVPVPALDALAIPAVNGNQVTFLDARTLLQLGEFDGIPSPSSVSWSDSGSSFATSDLRNGTATWWRIPPFHTLTLTGPPNEEIAVNGEPQALYAPGGVLHMWPQVVRLSVTRPGFLPGFTETTLLSNLTLEVPLGPTLSGISTLKMDFALETVALALLVFTGAIYLIYWDTRPQDPSPASPSRAPPEGEGGKERTLTPGSDWEGKASEATVGDLGRP